MTPEQHAQRIVRIVEFQGRTYEVSTDAAIRTTHPLSSYAHVWRVRKDGTRGRRITTDQIIYDVLHANDDPGVRA